MTLTPASAAVLRCTVQPHPVSGFTPILHLPGAVAPLPTVGAVSLPTVSEAIRYAVENYHVGHVEVSEAASAPVAVASAA